MSEPPPETQAPSQDNSHMVYEKKLAALQARSKKLEDELVPLDASIEAQRELVAKHENSLSDFRTQLAEVRTGQTELVSKMRHMQFQIQEAESARMHHRTVMADTRANLKFTDIKSLDRALGELRAVNGQKDVKPDVKAQALNEAKLLDAQRDRVKAFEAESVAESKKLEEANRLREEVGKVNKEIANQQRKEAKIAEKLGKQGKSAVQTEFDKLQDRKRKVLNQTRKVAKEISDLTYAYQQQQRQEENKKRKEQEKERKENQRKEQEKERNEQEARKLGKQEATKIPEAAGSAVSSNPKELYLTEKLTVAALIAYVNHLIAPQEIKTEKSEGKVPTTARPRNQNFKAENGVKLVKAPVAEEVVKNIKEKKLPASAPTRKVLVLLEHTPHNIMLFQSVGVAAPAVLADLPGTLAQLNAKLEFFNSAKTVVPVAQPRTDVEYTARPSTLSDFQKEAKDAKDLEVRPRTVNVSKP